MKNIRRQKTLYRSLLTSKKGFDTVDQKNLFNILYNLGFRVKFGEHITSYLIKRVQGVCCSENQSEWKLCLVFLKVLR